MLDYLRRKITSILQLRAIKRHGSRVGWRIAPKYTKYLHECRKTFIGAMPFASEAIAGAVKTFQRDGIASFHTAENRNIANLIYTKILQRQNDGEEMWGQVGASGNRNYTGCVYRDFPELEELFRGDVGRFLYHYYGTHFKIFNAAMFKSVNMGGAPQGSQLWHSDSGPGTCVVIAFYLHDVLDEGAGVLHALPWKHSVDIFKKEYNALLYMAKSAKLSLRDASRETRRDLIAKYYAKAIQDKYSEFVIGPKGPAGLVVPFLNNVIHFGGYPQPDRERLAVLFHCYPSDRPPDFVRYRNQGLAKSKPYPLNPSE